MATNDHDRVATAQDHKTPNESKGSFERRGSEPNPLVSQVKSSHITQKQWLQVLSSFMVFFNSWGLLLAFGSFQTYYEQQLLPDKSSSDISWLSTTSAFLLPTFGLISGPAFDHGYLRLLMVLGTILEILGLMMVSLSKEYYQVLLSQGICIGFGCGLLYIPSIAAAAVAFEDSKTRAKTMGLIASASGIGGVLYPIMFDRLLPRVGFPWAVRSIAFVALGTYVFSYLVLFYQPPKMASVRRLIDLSALTDVPFVYTTLAGFFSGMAYYVPLLYIPLFANTKISGFSSTRLALYLISIVNAASIFGRIGGGILAAKMGPLETYCIALGCSALLLLCWIAVDSTAGVIVWSVFWGLISSVIVSLPGAFVPILCPSLAVVGTRSGMFWAAIGLGVLIGSPIAGALIGNDEAELEWWRLQVFSGILMLASAICVIQPVLHVRSR